MGYIVYVKTIEPTLLGGIYFSPPKNMYFPVLGFANTFSIQFISQFLYGYNPDKNYATYCMKMRLDRIPDDPRLSHSSYLVEDRL